MGHTFPVAFGIAMVYAAVTGVICLLGGLSQSFLRRYSDLGGAGLVVFSLFFSSVVGFLILVSVPIDLALQRRRSGHNLDDLAFYPRLREARHWWQSLPARWTLILGVLFLLYRNTDMITGHTYRAAFVPEWDAAAIQILINLFCFYGLIWIADCLIRPHRGTIVGALVFSLFFWLYFVSADCIQLGPRVTLPVQVQMYNKLAKHW